MNTLPTLLFVWFAAQYLVGPIAVRLTLTAPDRYALPEIDWEMVDAFQQTSFLKPHNALLELGFKPITSTNVANVDAIYYWNPLDSATASIMVAKSTTVVEFTQVYVSGANLDVSNSVLPAVFPPRPAKVGYQLPGNQNLTNLFSTFKTLREGCLLGQRATVKASDVLRNVEDFLNVELEHLVGAGFYSREVFNGKRHVTMKGAYFMTWKLAWRSKLILLLLARHRAERAATT